MFKWLTATPLRRLGFFIPIGYSVASVADHGYRQNQSLQSTREIDSQLTADLIPLELNEHNMMPFTQLRHGVSYKMGFCTKIGLPLGQSFPIHHSAIFFYDSDTGECFVGGRQSPFSLMPTRWGVTTRIENEAKFLWSDYGFKGLLSTASFTFKEIMDLFQAADDFINQPQMCNMVHSNCYSASAFMLAKAIEIIASRPDVERHELLSLAKLLTHRAMVDHFGVGVLNNDVVMGEIKSALALVDKRIAEMNPSPSLGLSVSLQPL